MVGNVNVSYDKIVYIKGVTAALLLLVALANTIPS